MVSTSVQTVLQNALKSADVTREVVIGRSILSDVPAHLQQWLPGRTAMIVCDSNTFDIAGRQVQQALEQAGYPSVDPLIFPGSPGLRPRTEHVDHIVASLPDNALPIAVGSGTINDLTKRAAHLAEVDYAVVGTAASMDGYTAAGAALLVDGVKQTLPCKAPVLVIGDIDLMAAAPIAMTSSGYGDLLGKITAGADWIIADALGIEPIVKPIWQMVQGPLRSAIADPSRYLTGDPAAIEDLFSSLVITGLAIQAAGNTRCASGSEHQFSHLWEMRGLEFHGEPVSHGHKVALGTKVATSLYDQLFATDLANIDIKAIVSTWPKWDEIEAKLRHKHTIPALAEKAVEECRAKYLDPQELKERLTKLVQIWPEILPKLQSQLLPMDELQSLLVAAQCPIQPSDIGLDIAQMRETYTSAGDIRRRYTIYDLLNETNLLRQLVNSIFATNSLWHEKVSASS